MKRVYILVSLLLTISSLGFCYFSKSIIKSEDTILLNESISDNYQAGEYYYFDGIYGDNTSIIENAYYFENLNDNHGVNTGTLCTLISIQMILGYYDTFINDNTVIDTFITTSNYNALYTRGFVESPGTNNLFRNNLINISQFLDLDVSQGLFIEEQQWVLETYLDTIDINYELNTAINSTSDLTNNRSAQVIRNAIDNNRPVICNGTGHSSVAYAYDDDFVYVHAGNGFVAKTPWSTYNGSIDSFYDTGAIDLIISEHVHSRNYYSSISGKQICPCEEVVQVISNGIIRLDFDSVYRQYRIRYIAVQDVYVSFRTLGDFDTRFNDIWTTASYTYNDDTEGNNDDDYDYNAALSVWELKEGDTISFTVEALCYNVFIEFNTYVLVR